MRDSALVRLTATASLSISTLLCAQSRPVQQPPAATSTLPSTPPTTTPAVSAPPEVPLTPAQSPPQRAEVSYVSGDLTISASNSSLNQILRDISRLTGIKITGGVSEERVFGKYGPALTGDVLRNLLEGTSANMLYIQATGSNPSELILTTRTGGATPPNPNASRFDDTADDEDSTPRLPNRPPPPPPSESQSTPAPQNAAPQPITPAPADNNNSTTSSPSSDSNQQQSPNGVKTPQQIYEELQRLRQQQQQQQQTKPQ